tara:strand:- start:1379 stop:1729 length:351 start_codon:yes stop_codon:yes gene_type:complete
MKLIEFHNYNHLQKYSKAVLSHSGTIFKESYVANFPALNIRESHERPEAKEEVSVMMLELSHERIIQGLVQFQNQNNQKQLFKQFSDYSMPNVFEKVVERIINYTDNINKVIWNQY